MSKPKKSPINSNNPLLMAKGAISKCLKTDDWHTELDPNQIDKTLPHLPTGSLVINHLIGGKPNAKGVPPCPGFPKGRIVNIYGAEGCGKTTVALSAAAATTKAGGTVCYIDWENEIVPDYASALGVPIEDSSKFMLCQPSTLEEGLVISYGMASAGVDLVVFDSVGAGVPEVALKDLGNIAHTGRVGQNASYWSNFLPKLKNQCAKSKTVILGISQVRDNIDTTGYGEKKTVQGGKAWRFYSTLRMFFSRIAQEKQEQINELTRKKEERVTGCVSKVKLEKCKVSSQQGNEEVFYIRWGQGIDDLRSMLEVAKSYDIIKAAGSWFTWVKPDGSEIRQQGMDKIRVMVAKDPVLRDILTKQVTPILAGGKVGATDSTEELFEDEEEEEGLELDLDSLMNGLQGIKTPPSNEEEAED